MKSYFNFKLSHFYWDTLHNVYTENAEFRFLWPPSGTCFKSYFDKSCKQGASIALRSTGSISRNSFQIHFSPKPLKI